MISIKKALEIADEFIKTIYGEVEETQLEEIETDDAKTTWFMTVSFIIKDSVRANMTGPLASLYSANPYKRKFKTLIINATTGEVIKMKIWPLENAK